MPALVALILANLPTIITAGEAGWKFIQSVRTAAKQSGEWTDEVEAAFQAKLAAESITPAWLPDALAPAPTLPPVASTVLADLATLNAAPPVPTPPPAPPAPAPVATSPAPAADAWQHPSDRPGFLE